MGTDEVRTIKSELAKIEEILINYMSYNNILFKLSSLEGQEAQDMALMNTILRHTLEKMGARRPGVPKRALSRTV